MFSKLEVFQTSISMAKHAGSRQAVIASNIANADTPGYRARSISSFRDHVRTDASTTMRATRPGHLTPQSRVADAPRIMTAESEPTPNGNSVSIETEMVNSVEVQREHSRALAIYEHSLKVLRSSLGRR